MAEHPTEPTYPSPPPLLEIPVEVDPPGATHAVLEERIRGVKQAIFVQSREYERRLAELNNSADRLRQVLATAVSSDKFDDYVKTQQLQVTVALGIAGDKIEGVASKFTEYQTAARETVRVAVETMNGRIDVAADKLTEAVKQQREATAIALSAANDQATQTTTRVERLESQGRENDKASSDLNARLEKINEIRERQVAAELKMVPRDELKSLLDTLTNRLETIGDAVSTLGSTLVTMRATMAGQSTGASDAQDDSDRRQKTFFAIMGAAFVIVGLIVTLYFGFRNHAAKTPTTPTTPATTVVSQATPARIGLT